VGTVRRVTTPTTVRVFHELMGALDPPMFVVTVESHGERSGCLVGFATQCSIDPPRFLACISRANHTCRVAARADAMAVHALAENQRDVAELFGSETGDDVDKFAAIDWTPAPDGSPVLAGCAGWFSGAVLDRVDLGDHIGYLLEPRHGGRDERVTQLDFHRVKDIEPGHEA
jgi:flavin reductase (DIM6/NTAB) family NADH-FMN oxidoreductase RutF